MSGRQFQSPDFVLPEYDLINRKHVSTQCFVIGRVPSTCASPNVMLPSKSVAYARISPGDLQLAGKYKEECANAVSKGDSILMLLFIVKTHCKYYLFISGLRMPKCPVSVSVSAVNFFRDIELATKPVQHSQSASISNRQDVYAAHYTNGKATIWLTISPDDTKQYRIMWFALSPLQSSPYRDLVPLGNLRFDILAKHPVAAALYFERVVRLVIRNVIGWDELESKPFKDGGLFGIAKAWLRVIEEQSRLTLHAHFLIWLVGHSDIERQLTESLPIVGNREVSVMKNEIECAQQVLDIHGESVVSVGESVPSFAVDIGHTPLKSEFLSVSDDIQHILDRVKANVNTFVLGELVLPKEEMEVGVTCCVPSCGGAMSVRRGVLSGIRRKHRPSALEIPCLRCDRFNGTSTVSCQLESALEHGFQHCFSKNRPNSEQVTDIIWKSLAARPLSSCGTAHDCWLLELAAVHLSVNLHDWKHRGSCFKNGQNVCRYKLPKDECSECVVCMIRQSATCIEERIAQGLCDDSSLQLLITIKKGVPYLFLTDCNRSLLEVFNCNNCVCYVENQKISMYCGGYSSKYCNDNEKSVSQHC